MKTDKNKRERYADELIVCLTDLITRAGGVISRDEIYTEIMDTRKDNSHGIPEHYLQLHDIDSAIEALVAAEVMTEVEEKTYKLGSPLETFVKPRPTQATMIKAAFEESSKTHHVPEDAIEGAITIATRVMGMSQHVAETAVRAFAEQLEPSAE